MNLENLDYQLKVMTRDQYYKVAVIGSRGFNQYDVLCKILDDNLNISEIISGGAMGADSLGERYAIERGIPVTIFRPDWDKYGKRAGFIRNTDIVTAADIIVAFWDGISKGTANSIATAGRLGKPVIIINYKQ